MFRFVIFYEYCIVAIPDPGIIIIIIIIIIINKYFSLT